MNRIIHHIECIMYLIHPESVETWLNECWAVVNLFFDSSVLID